MNKQEKIFIMELLVQECFRKSEEHDGCFVDKDFEYYDKISSLHKKLFDTTFKDSMYWGLL